MIFNSFNFIVFFAATVVSFYALPHRARWVLLLAASCVFYMAWNPLLMLLLLFSVFVNYISAVRMEAAAGKKSKKRWLIFCLLISFGILFIFKYLVFFTDAAATLLSALGFTVRQPEFSIILPMGISFYTFQAVGYAIDVYRGDLPAERNFLKILLFITFFPQLVAGPIERAGSLKPQLFSEKHFKLDNFITGFKFMCFGFFQKVVIADRVAVAVNTVYNSPTRFVGLPIALATLLFAFQIYCDFGGYSNIAIGCAKMLDIDLMQNFKQPYFSPSIKVFWRRWHISLSTWFKDYVYFPLGGSRVGKWRHRFNTMATFLISGMWHGANWTFLIWGALHGAYQVIGDMLPKRRRQSGVLATFFKTLVTFGLVCVTWVFFRANSIADAFYLLRHMPSGYRQWPNIQYIFDVLNGMGLTLLELIISAGCILLLVVTEFFAGGGCVHERLLKTPSVFRFAFYTALALAILSFGVYYNAGQFIYFQF